ncbi:glycosyltransferase family 4 protein [Phocaeicola coprophilus]|nr:glycosyltransferase family 4 protein [Phocaeicola coprophilus]
MKIILVNYRYFISGGPERYYFNIKEVLERNGHEVIPFSIKSSRNLPNDYEKYFLDIVDDEVYFAQSKKSLKVILKSFARMFYSFEAKRKFKRLLQDTRPDLVYVMQFHNKISPSIIDAAQSLRIPVVHRISDFQYMCPNALFYNDVKGVCEDCLKGKRLSCVKYKCVLNSTVYSGIKMAAKWLHDCMKITRKINAFVVPSSFTLKKLNEYGIPMDKLHHIPTFFNLKEENPEVEYNPFILFVGRIEKQKGLMTLIKTFEGTDYNLKIIGFSNDGYEDMLKDYLKGKQHHIEFLGRKSFEDIVPYLKSCLCTVVPSEWYDNFPNVILESFAYKKAVIATDFGSLPELVHDNQTGLTFKYADIEDFRVKVKYMFEHVNEARQMGERAYQSLVRDYSPKAHYEALMKLFNKLVTK